MIYIYISNKYYIYTRILYLTTIYIVVYMYTHTIIQVSPKKCKHAFPMHENN